MGLFDWLTGSDETTTVRLDALADRLAMDLMNRILILPDTGLVALAGPNAEKQPVQRETAYMLSSLVFCTLPIHPLFDEATEHRFFSKFLQHLEIYGHEAELWPHMQPSFLKLMYPDRMDAHLDAIAPDKLANPEQLGEAIQDVAEVAARRISQTEEPSDELIQKLKGIGKEHFEATLQLFEQVDLR